MSGMTMITILPMTNNSLGSTNTPTKWKPYSLPQNSLLYTSGKRTSNLIPPMTAQPKPNFCLLQCNKLNNGIITIILHPKNNSPGTTNTSPKRQHQALPLILLTNSNHGPNTTLAPFTNINTWNTWNPVLFAPVNSNHNQTFDLCFSCLWPMIKAQQCLW